MSDPTSFDPLSPLARIPGESLRANTALRDYYYMGMARSLRALLAEYRRQADNKEAAKKPPTRRETTIFQWSKNQHWQARIEAQKTIEDKADQDRWEARRREVKEFDWTQGQSLRDLANRVIAEGPNFIKTKRKIIRGTPRVIDADGKTIDPGTPDQIVVTMALDGGFAVRAATTGSQLTRLASGLETERTGLDISGNLGVVPKLDLDDIDNNRLTELLAESSRLLMALASGKGFDPKPGADSEIHPNQ